MASSPGATSPAPASDPDVPTEAVGTLRLPDLSPYVRSRIALIFVAAAATGAVVTLPSVLQAGDWFLLSAILLASGVAVILTPAALLWRLPAAPRIHPLLVAGLTVAAIERVRFITIDQVAGRYLPGFITYWWWLLVPIGAVLVGLGLARLRTRPLARVGLLLALVAAFVIILAVNLAQFEALDDPRNVLVLALRAPAVAFAAWVALGAWLDRDEPRRFWALLALGVPVALGSSVLAVVSVLVQGAPGEGFSTAFVVQEAVNAAFAVVVLVAYGRLFPAATRTQRVG